ncbi:hypothetical protein D3C85_1658020 [compost metagenome]
MHGGNADFLGAKDLAKQLLQHQGQPPGRQERIQWAVVHEANEAAFKQEAKGKGHREGNADTDNEIPAHELRKVALEHQ